MVRRLCLIWLSELQIGPHARGPRRRSAAGVDEGSPRGVLRVNNKLPKSENSITTLLAYSLEEHLKIIQTLLDTRLDEIERAGEMICRTLSGGRKVLLCGNGGSAADA